MAAQEHVKKMHYAYSDIFEHTITSTYGTKGSQWLVQLPQIIAQCAALWSLTDLKPYRHLSYNYVLSGMMQSMPIVLKLRCDHVATEKEAAALKAFESFGGVKLLASTLPEVMSCSDNSLAKSGALLLERALPGELLTTFFPKDDRRATRFAAACLQSLHQTPITPIFPSLESVLPLFTDEPDVLVPFIGRARTFRNQLIRSQEKTVLLHGDFHQGNILSSGEQWMVIDPEGIIGDPIYDVAVYIRNPLTDLIELPSAKTIIENRINDFAELLGYDKQRIYDWTYLQAATSAYWSIEDGLDASRHVGFLRSLEGINKA